jgi:HlyD family secretion protein
MGTRWLTVLLVAALAGAGGYYYWQQRGTGQLDVQTVALTRGDLRRVVSTTGAVSALVTVDVGSQLSGKIGELNVDFSSKVKQGQVLARIEPFTFESAVREQEAGVAIAEANIALQQAGVERADANLHKAELDLTRAQQLVTKGATSQSAVDTALAAQLSAKADLATAHAQVDNAKATLAQRHATLDGARIDLDRTFIRSPIDGVVIDRAVETGQTVAASMTAPKLFTIAEDLSHVQILAQVDEADIGQVTAGNPVSFTVDAYPDVKFEGKVEQIRLASVTLQNVVTYTVVIGAENPQGRLLPGMTANVEIVTGEHAQVVLAPNEALRFQPAGPVAALVRDPGQTSAVQATPGDRSARLLDKLKTGLGLSESELDKVRAGLEVEFTAIKNAGPPGAAPSEGDAREQARMRIAKVLRAVLTAEQYQKYQEMQKQRPTGPRKATLWTYEAGGLVPHEVRLGLADANGTEIEDGLPEGANVVVRVREMAP